MYTKHQVNMSSESKVFFHRAVFPGEDEHDVLEIEITFDSTYTIKMTHTGKTAMSACWPKEVTYIHDVPYLPKSLLKMLSITGGNDYWIVHKIIQNIRELCTETLPKEKKEIETKFESEICQLRAELASSQKRNEELSAKFYEIQDKNTELVDIIVDQLQKIGQLEETNQELVQMTKSIEEHSLDTMLESAFDELHL